MSASQAASYCRNLALAGHTVWTLPTIEELRARFGGEADEGGHHIQGPIKLTGWQCSRSPGQERGEPWELDFGDGSRASVVTGDSGLNRAFCVYALPVPRNNRTFRVQAAISTCAKLSPLLPISA